MPDNLTFASVALLKEVSKAFRQLSLSPEDRLLQFSPPPGDRRQVSLYRRGTARVRVEETEVSAGNRRATLMDADSAIVQIANPTAFKARFPSATMIGRGTFVVHFRSLDSKVAAFGDDLNYLNLLRDFLAGQGFPDLKIEPNLYLDAPELKKATFAQQAAIGQWNMGPSANGGIERDEAHGVSKGNATIVVAVIDSEIRRDHVALASAKVLPQLEVTDSNAPTGAKTNWHGTACASVIVAQGNEDLLGVAPGCTLLPIKVPFPPTMEDLAKGFELAREGGAKIVSLSYATPQRSESFRKLLEDNGNILVIVAAGNDDADLAVTPLYPASFTLPNIISVVASDQGGALVKFSNYAATDAAHLAAPGADVRACDIEDSSDTATMTGTSIAAPHVAGVAALLWSISPEASPASIKQWILESVTTISVLSVCCRTGGFLNAARAARRAAGLPMNQAPIPA